MNKTDTLKDETERTKHLVEKLSKHPVLRERVEALLKLVESGEEGRIVRADDFEELLIPEIRKLGANVIEEWAVGAEVRSAAQLQEGSPSALCIKKKS